MPAVGDRSSLSLDELEVPGPMIDRGRRLDRSALPEPGVDDRFVLEAQVGAGAMGAVYRARDRQTGAVVALKLLTVHESWAAERFRQEAEVLRALDHPGIVKYVAHGIHGTAETGRLFLAMEWLEGEDLDA